MTRRLSNLFSHHHIITKTKRKITLALLLHERSVNVRQCEFDFSRQQKSQGSDLHSEIATLKKSLKNLVNSFLSNNSLEQLHKKITDLPESLDETKTRKNISKIKHKPSTPRTQLRQGSGSWLGFIKATTSSAGKSPIE